MKFLDQIETTCELAEMLSYYAHDSELFDLATDLDEQSQSLRDIVDEYRNAVKAVNKSKLNREDAHSHLGLQYQKNTMEMRHSLGKLETTGYSPAGYTDVCERIRFRIYKLNENSQRAEVEKKRKLVRFQASLLSFIEEYQITLFQHLENSAQAQKSKLHIKQKDELLRKCLESSKYTILNAMDRYSDAYFEIKSRPMRTKPKKYSAF